MPQLSSSRVVRVDIIASMSVSKGFRSREDAGVETSEGRRRSVSVETLRVSVVVTVVVGFPLETSCVVVVTVATGVVAFSLTVSEAILNAT